MGPPPSKADAVHCGGRRGTITIEGLNHDPALRGVIVHRLQSLARRLRPAPVSARVAFTDENRPGGVEVPTHRLAFDAAFAGLELLSVRDRETTRGPGMLP